MALKDWKKTKGKLEWTKKTMLPTTTIIKYVITINRNNRLFIYIYNDTLGFDFGKRIKHKDESFKTKQEALKFAIEYMKTH